MNTLLLSLFALAVLGCAFSGQSVMYALVFGYLLFFGYALSKGHPAKELLRLTAEGIYKVRTILILFLLIGMLTAIWRCAGTIPVLLCAASDLFSPRTILLLCFLLNSALSVLTGTSFGTVATMGVVTMGVATAAGLSPALSGGAILSGIFFGDRCSPVSSSALLVAEVTGTDLHENIRGMLRTGWLPFLLSAGFYLAAGWLTAPASLAATDLRALFGSSFVLSWAALLPAVLILVLSALRVNVKLTLLVSVLCGIAVSWLVQGAAPAALPRILFFGFHADDPALAALIDGGGIASMFGVSGIVMLSSSYAGLFAATGLLDGISAGLDRLVRRTNRFTGVLAAALLASLISCNQTLATMLTEQLCTRADTDPKELALQLENSVIVLSPLVPWSIAGAVPVATLGAPFRCLLFACFLYLVPLCGLVQAALQSRRAARSTL